MKKLLVAAIVVSIPQAAFAQMMNAQAFYQRASALQKKGIAAIFSGGEIKTLMAEGQAAGKKARQQREAALASHQKPRFCPPPGVVKIDSDEFMKRLSAIPASDRSRIDMTEATTRILAAKYPCTA
jgi:hypothetical protein